MIFVNIDGPDGVGKSSLVKGLCEYYESKGKKVSTLHFPRYQTPIGQIIKEALYNRTAMDSRALQMLYSADRINFTKFDLPQLEQELDILFVDRYITSGIVFGEIDGVPASDIKLFDATSKKPDINLILLATPETLMRRMSDKQRDKFETLNTQRRAIEIYENIDSHVNPVYFINAENPKHKVLNNTIKILEEQFKFGGW